MALTSTEQGGKDFLLKMGNNFSGSVTFQNTGDTVTQNAHGLLDGQQVKFSAITGPTTITTSTIYYVVNSTTNTFKLAATLGGTAIALDADGTGTAVEVFEIIGGLRSTTWSFSADEIEITNQESGQYKTLLNQAGIRSVSLSGECVFKDNITHKVARTVAMAQSLRNWQVISNSAGDYWSGSFKITSLEQTGGHDNEQTVSLSMSSSGSVSYTEI